MPLDDADKKFITDSIAAAIAAGNADALTAEKVQKIVDDKLGGLDIDGKIAAATKKGDDEEEKKKGESGDEYAARMAELEKKQQAAEERERQAIARERENAMEGELAAALTAHGIPRERHAQAIAYLRTQKSAHSGKAVFDFDDNGKPIYRRAGKGYDDTLTIADGIKGWSETDEAKMYRPPADRNGTGTGGGGGRGGSGGGKETSINEILGSLNLG